ncbi:unnamed protein product [Kluyveromyces dobzhanskii CBS 2104]|uniref:WGS project CCBQ000000000 data, contig 00272 n=1 Tax=Kluyveromyces dobzhanskii CBS 2104 TaxID=1427455 RepID=A0A0A8LB53_9SACH|nr:unnamed protein product [Kluyveromyces dobzhanskii CBS 2104]
MTTASANTDKLTQKINQLSFDEKDNSLIDSTNPAPFPGSQETKSETKESAAKDANAKPRTTSFLNNDGIDQLTPVTRKKRVSSISLSDQWSSSQAGIQQLSSLTPLNGGQNGSQSQSRDSVGGRASRSNSVRQKREIIDHERVASYAFAFDIDGVIVRGPETIPEARTALRMLNGENKYNIKVPYIFITNGGGRSERARCKDLSKRLGITVTEDQVIQGHTPMKDLVPVYKNVLVVGGVLNSCREVAKGYGFKNVYIPIDIMKWNPSVTPYYELSDEEKEAAVDADFSKINIDAILVFADSRNWAADQQIILELLLSKNGVMGTVSESYEDGPGLYFAHSDFVWATDYGLSRYGMGALQVSIAALYQEHTGKELQVTRFGKPQRGTFRFAEKVLSKWRKNTLETHVEQLGMTIDKQQQAQRLKQQQANDSPFGPDSETDQETDITSTEDDDELDEEDDDDDDEGIVINKTSKIVLDLPPASTVYFVGDTPESDIRFANSHDSSWYSILVKTGVFQEGTTPKYQPKQLCENVLEAVRFAIEREHKKELEEWNHSAEVSVPVTKEETESVKNIK